MSADPRLYDGSAGPPPAPDPDRAWVTGGVLFAGVLMLCQGVVAALQGIAALGSLVGAHDRGGHLRDDSDVYGTVGDYLYRFSLTSWGWIHLVLGVCAAITGAGLLKGAGWARVAGILFASLALFAQFLFLPYAPGSGR
ncbi:hypothetical protein [Streptomyces cyaneofuscatus]|uniref:DUF7144 family membrane protein n=1 Tax=Streptomyces cyaneofuscatus TaxID=66883 RepID=UPI00365CD31D